MGTGPTTRDWSRRDPANRSRPDRVSRRFVGECVDAARGVGLYNNRPRRTLMAVRGRPAGTHSVGGRGWQRSPREGDLTCDIAGMERWFSF